MRRSRFRRLWRRFEGKIFFCFFGGRWRAGDWDGMLGWWMGEGLGACVMVGREVVWRCEGWICLCAVGNEE
jgi:hypothetical protein